jgi:hypothetical protein
LIHFKISTDAVLLLRCSFLRDVAIRCKRASFESKKTQI